MNDETKLTPLKLLDMVLRKEYYSTTIGNIYSFKPESIQLICELGHGIGLCTDDLHVEDFIGYFKLETIKDLNRITVEDLWRCFAADKGLLSCINDIGDITFRYAEGIRTFEDALEFVTDEDRVMKLHLQRIQEQRARKE